MPSKADGLSASKWEFHEALRQIRATDDVLVLIFLTSTNATAQATIKPRNPTAGSSFEPANQRSIQLPKSTSHALAFGLVELRARPSRGHSYLLRYYARSPKPKLHVRPSSVSSLCDHINHQCFQPEQVNAHQTPPIPIVLPSALHHSNILSPDIRWSCLYVMYRLLLESLPPKN